MDVISDTMYEIFGAVLLMIAITIVISLNSAGVETTKAVDSNVRSKTTITEGVSTINKELVSGSSVYYNICQFAKDQTDIQIYITKESAPSVKTAITQSVLNQIRDQDVSKALLNELSGTEDKKYKIIYNTDNEGTIKSVTYQLQDV